MTYDELPLGTVMVWRVSDGPNPTGWVDCDGAEHDGLPHGRERLPDLRGHDYWQTGTHRFIWKLR